MTGALNGSGTWNPDIMTAEEAGLSSRLRGADARSVFGSDLRGTNSHGATYLGVGRKRLGIVAIFFGFAFFIISAKLVELTWQDTGPGREIARGNTAPSMVGRASIVDRNGIVLATSLRADSLYANPGKIMDAAEAARKLVRVLPDLSRDAVMKKLSTDRSFVWLKRNLTPRQQWRVNELGIPGFAFQEEQRRVYPHGSLAAHVLGFVDVDNNGISGIERYFDDELGAPVGDGNPLATSLDIRVQYVLRDELQRGMRAFRAKGAAGIVLDVKTGEVAALVSLPDFDPNNAGPSKSQSHFNRATLGVYELGSVFKTFTTAMALDAGVVKLTGGYDATDPLRVDRFVIRDSHAKKRWLSVPEIFMYSSNIGSAKMAMEVGEKRQRKFLDRLGLTRRPTLELPEVGTPLVPDPWREINTMTISYGHGIAVSPLQLSTAAAAVVNGGVLVPATLLRRDRNDIPEGVRVVSSKTSAKMRRLLRLAVLHGTGSKADVRGYLVGGKTGTAEKPSADGYQRDAVISTFIADFPSDDPRYLVLVMYDEPKGTTMTKGYAGAGWTSAPVARRIIERIAPLLGVQPASEEEDTDDLLIMVKG
ncbi:MAG: penicillin-binding protein 2 [Rhodospirillales bacterium]|nr:penicillin-binding protein 2 [Rhodospirillales bacterium]